MNILIFISNFFLIILVSTITFQSTANSQEKPIDNDSLITENLPCLDSSNQCVEQLTKQAIAAIDNF